MGATHFSGLITSGLRKPRGRDWFVDTLRGSNGDGSDWDNAFTTMTAALRQVHSNDVIHAVGNIREQCVGPQGVFDVCVLGYGNTPRNSDDFGAGFQSRTSTTWRGPASPVAATPLMEVRHQGWLFENILFNAPTDAAAIKLVRNALATTNEDDASHAAIQKCRFVGGQNGIEDAGGCYNVLVEDSEFFNITDGTGRAIWCSSTAVANPLFWKVFGNLFLDNDNHIVAAASKWMIGKHGHGNVFSSANVTAKILLTGGIAGNIITGNFLGGTYSNVGGYTGAGAGDEWMGNYASTTPTISDPA